MTTDATEKLADLAKVFKALGHPTRLWIVRSLANGEKCVLDFVKGTKVDFSAVSQHLTVLKEAGIVKAEKRGKNVFYSLIYRSLPWFIECLKLRDKSATLTEEQWRKLANRHRKLFINYLKNFDFD